MRQIKSLKLSGYKLHIIFWLVFITAVLFIDLTLSRKFLNPFNYAGNCILDTGIFYLNTWICSVLPKRQYLYYYTAGFIAEIVFYCLIKYFLCYALSHLSLYDSTLLKFDLHFLTNTV